MWSVGSGLLMNHSPLAHIAMSVLKVSLHWELWTRAWCWAMFQCQRARDLRRRRNEPSPEQQLICTQWCLIVWLLLALVLSVWNTESLYALLLLFRTPLEVRLTTKMVTWDPWFHQKEIYLSIYQAAMFGLSLKDCSERSCSNMTDDCRRLLMLCLWLTCSTAH